jgi:hypothetical protein
LSPPVCASCATLLQRTCFFEREHALCDACATKRRDTYAYRCRVWSFGMIVGAGLFVIGILYIDPPWGSLVWGLGFVLGSYSARAQSCVPPVEGPRPVDSPLPKDTGK